MFSERKYQTLVSISLGCEWGLYKQEPASRSCGFSPPPPPVSSPELQRQREVCEHQVSAARAGQQGLPRAALQAVEQYISRGVTLPPGRIGYARDTHHFPDASLVFHRNIPN